MTREESLTIVAEIANNWPGNQWNTDTLDAYARAIEPLDGTLVTLAVMRAVRELEFYPRVAVLLEFVQIERRLAEPEPPADRMAVIPDFKRPVPAWVKAWVVARYIHNDFRVLPDQKPGYDSLQNREPAFRTYVWPDQDLMPEQQAFTYAEMGAGLTVAHVFDTVRGTTSRVI